MCDCEFFSSKVGRTTVLLNSLQCLTFYGIGNVVRELDVPGEILERKTYPFEFSTVEMQYESYNGVNVRLR